jgi:putative endonuclease
MDWYAYVLQNAHGRKYHGSTGRPPELRLAEHNAGRGRWTRAHRPWRLIHAERFDTKSAAQTRQRFFKTGAGRDYLDRVSSAG